MRGTEASIYRFSADLLDGQTVDFSSWKGKVLLIVNTASQCGFTPQYAALEEIYRQYKEQGLAVLGFPCNQFGAQEPGGPAEIGQFCARNYGVSFPMFAKIDVNGPGAHPLYKFLKESKPGLFGLRRITWNFTKYLIDRTGRAVSRHAPWASPYKLKGRIEDLLRQT